MYTGTVSDTTSTGATNLADDTGKVGRSIKDYCAGVQVPLSGPYRSSTCPYCTPKCPHGYPADVGTVTTGFPIIVRY